MWAYRISALVINVIYMGVNVYFVDKYLLPIDIDGTIDCTAALHRRTWEILPAVLYSGAFGIIDMIYAAILLWMFIKPLKQVCVCMCVRENENKRICARMNKCARMIKKVCLFIT